MYIYTAVAYGNLREPGVPGQVHVKPKHMYVHLSHRMYLSTLESTL